jgi:anti-anti-sigma factor
VSPRPVFGADLSYSEGQTNLHLKGELDLATRDEFHAALAEAEAADAALVVIDLRELRFIDFSGVRALVSAVESATRNNHRIVFTQGSAAVERTFELAGVVLPRT